MDIYKSIKTIWDWLDMAKLNSDIIEGTAIAAQGNIKQKSNYVLKIQKDYAEYIEVYNAIKIININLSGGNSSQQIITTNDINSYIKLLQIIKNAKMLNKAYDEIFK